MSLQAATEGSGSPKSRSKEHNLITRVFTFEGTGSLKDRLLTAVIVLAVALALSVAATYLPYGGLVCVGVTAFIALGSVFEVVRLFSRQAETLHYRPVAGVISFCTLGAPTVVAVIVATQSVLYARMDWRLLLAGVLLSGVGLMIAQAIEGRTRLEDAARFAERYGPAFFIVALCAPQLVVVSGSPYGVPLLWWMVAVVACNDAAAYFVGSSLGKHLMAPGLSPRKTIEGSLAGVVVGAFSGVVFWRLLLGDLLSISQLATVSVVMTIVAQAGDLSKSYLKRLRGVKDTGAIFPGHGGILDRFDALIAVSPVVLVMLMMVGLV